MALEDGGGGTISTWVPPHCTLSQPVIALTIRNGTARASPRLERRIVSEVDDDAGLEEAIVGSHALRRLIGAIELVFDREGQPLRQQHLHSGLRPEQVVGQFSPGGLIG